MENISVKNNTCTLALHPRTRDSLCLKLCTLFSHFSTFLGCICFCSSSQILWSTPLCPSRTKTLNSYLKGEKNETKKVLKQKNKFTSTSTHSQKKQSTQIVCTSWRTKTIDFGQLLHERQGLLWTCGYKIRSNPLNDWWQHILGQAKQTNKKWNFVSIYQ